MSTKEIELNIQPEAGILSVFSRLNYKPWYAIAEFVDNSTQSFYNHEKELAAIGFKKLEIDIFYDDKKKTLTVIDNAYGMDLENFKRAILLDAKDPKQQGRNEFGMGLKTAASWFGNLWGVGSTQLDSTLKYGALIDIRNLKENHINTIKIVETMTSAIEHGTKVVIQDITKSLSEKAINKTIDLLGSIYRRDILSNKVQIQFNGTLVTYKPNNILSFRDKEWKKELDFEFSFNDKQYRVDGFVAIMNPGSFPDAGFALFKNDRVVVGGYDMNYKPLEIFGQAQSQISLKLFGELNMHGFPINQSKDGFIWDNGLEDEFIKHLKVNIEEYRQIADISKKAREEEDQVSKQKSETIEEKTKQLIEKMQTIDMSHSSFDGNASGNSDLEQFKEDFLDIKDDIKQVGSIRQYPFKLNKYETVSLNVSWATGKQDYWIDVETKDKTINVVINIDHPFFKPYSKQEDFKFVLEKLVIAFVLAEKQALVTSAKDGYVLPSVIRNKINEYLSKLL